MTEEITKILNDESYTTTEERTSAITSALAKLVIPKDKYNDLSSKLKTTESSLQEMQTKVEDLERAKMSDSEKLEDDRKKLDEGLKELKIKSNRLDVIEILKEAGLGKEDYTEEDLQTIVSEDAEKSKSLANFLVKTLTNNSEKVKQQTQVDLLNNTPKPVAGESAQVSKTEDLQSKLDEAIKNKDTLAQARLIREIQEEQSKTNEI